MPVKSKKKSSKRSKPKKLSKDVLLFLGIRRIHKHVFNLYALTFFTWVVMITSFVETTGTFVLNLRAVLVGIILGILISAIIRRYP